MSPDSNTPLPKQPRRTWRQWSKRTRVRIGFVLMLIVAISAFSWWWPRRGMVAIVWAGGGFFELELNQRLINFSRRLPAPVASVVTPWLASHGGWLSTDDRIESVTLDSVRSPDFDLAWLRRFHHLQSMTIHGRHIGAGLRRMSGLKQLTSIDLYDVQPTSDLGELRHLPNVREMTIRLHTDTDGALDGLRLLPNLRSITFRVQPKPCAIRGAGQCANLESIHLANGIVDDDNLRYLDGLTRLRTFVSDGKNPIGKIGLRHLVTISSLESVQLRSTLATKEELLVLASLPKLKRLIVGGPNLTHDDLGQLMDAMPNCIVILY